MLTLTCFYPIKKTRAGGKAGKGERKKKIANLLRRSEMSKLVESQTDPTFDESQSKGTFALWSEIFKILPLAK